MTNTQRHVALLIIAIVAIYTCAHAQDGIAWLHEAAPFNIRTGAYSTLHPGMDDGGLSFGLMNRIEIPVHTPTYIEGAILLNARRLHGGGDVLVNSALTLGGRHQWFLGEELMLPLRVGIASVISTGTVTGTAEQDLCMYAGVRPTYRVSRGIELAVSTGLTLSRKFPTLRPEVNVGIRMGSVFTFSFDLAGIWMKPGIEHTRPPFL